MTNVKPALTVQSGNVRIPIWKNTTNEGKTYYKAGEPEVSYKAADGKWHPSKSYSAKDLVKLATCALKARDEVSKRNFEAKAPEQEAA